jgi:hypothetical protein
MNIKLGLPFWKEIRKEKERKREGKEGKIR